MEKLTGKVVLADDDLTFRELIKKIISSMGLEIAGEAENGQKAVELYRKHRPDLLLLDINMPEKNGEEALKEIIKEFPDALVIMLTSVDELESIQDCLCMGAELYIKKGASREEINKAILKAWDKKAGGH